MTGRLPPLGRCGLCGLVRHLSAHKSRRDGLVRLLCTPCFSAATLTEEAGYSVDWEQAQELDAAWAGVLGEVP